jgi:hypothetical protein
MSVSIAQLLTNSFAALVEDRLTPLRGPLARSFMGTILGVVMDSIAERYRLGIRAQLAVDGTTTPSHFAWLRRRYGVPTYPRLDETVTADYLSELARLRATTTTHPLAGSAEHLEAEVSYGTGVSLGSVDVRSIDVDLGWTVIESAEFDDPISFDDGSLYDDGHTYDVTVTSAQSRAIAAIVEYFFEGGTKLRRIDK